MTFHVVQRTIHNRKKCDFEFWKSDMEIQEITQKFRHFAVLLLINFKFKVICLEIPSHPRFLLFVL